MQGRAFIFNLGFAVGAGIAATILHLGQGVAESVDWQAGGDAGSVDCFAGNSWLEGEPLVESCDPRWDVDASNM